MPAFYQDSVVLMRVAAKVRTHPGVHEVALFMGTPANHALLEQAGLSSDAARAAGANDLIIAVEADDGPAGPDAVAAVKSALVATTTARKGGADYRPRTLDAALRTMPDANVVALSVPGAYVRAEAMAALRRDLHVFIFSDNVPVGDEIALKQEAVRRGLLCMGPDQGTAYIGGTGLGFANVVPRGRVGCVAASGTGLQAVVARLDALGEGVSHTIGVGGRDLSEAVGGLMTLAALDALSADAATQGIVVVSKPPHPDVLARVTSKLASIAKPVVVCCIGAPARSEGTTIWVDTLGQAGDAMAALLGGRPWEASPLADAARVEARLRAAGNALEGRRIAGLYTGGTLAYEAAHVLRSMLGSDDRHRIVDLGDDAYTVGRPHPMIDPGMRADMIAKAAADPEVGVILVDVVLGKGAHANPAGEVAAAWGRARAHARGAGRELAMLACVVGTSGDPQGLDAQRSILERAGVDVLATNADAARCAALLVRPAPAAGTARKVA
ncbi:MAG TPA: acyl-CoA synthetase FdrA [Casimicrobiaceae bacterium]|nr:acyl-CoA synthetase FdrA [Casimicrobiaceae bacterium]